MPKMARLNNYFNIAAGRGIDFPKIAPTGVVIAGGSDFPVESPNPFHGIHAAVARRPLSGGYRDWQPEQRMTREEAVRV
jgi:predicted amidohydrolase YtcJ